MRIAAFLLLVPLAGCGPAESDPGPGGVTVGEAKALDDAAAMLDERRLPPEALPEAPSSATPDEQASGVEE